MKGEYATIMDDKGCEIDVTTAPPEPEIDLARFQGQVALFKSGDVVQLKSGGPFMTVWQTQENGEVDCRWFNDGQPCRSGFVAPMLRKVDTVFLEGKVETRELPPA